MLCLSVPAFAQTGKKYVDFPSASSVGGTDVFLILQGVNKQATAAQVATYVLTAGQPGHFSTVTATGLVSTVASGTGGAGFNLAPVWLQHLRLMVTCGSRPLACMSAPMA
jgi:hypothetical protein